MIQHERIQTTVPRAKELRPFVERLITIARRSLKAGDGSNAGVTARRIVAADIADRDVVRKLFDTLAPRFADRPGGYTRLLRVGYRRGDSAEVAEVELLGSEFNPNAEAEAAKAGDGDKPKKKSIGGRLRDVLGGGRKKKDDTGDTRQGKASVSRSAKGPAKKVTTPRKAGGS